MQSPKSVRARSLPDPAKLTLGELMATQPNRIRGQLMPGERFPTGMRPGRRRAQGMDLDSISPYVPGDDVRWMDWRATARTERAQMKRFVAESHLARVLIVDYRPHLLFGTESQPMVKTAALLAAQLAWEALLLQEPVGLVIVPELIQVRPRRGRSHILFLLKHLEDHYPVDLMTENQSISDDHLIAAIDTASSMLATGDELCVFSDFGDYEDSLALKNKVRTLSAMRHLRAVVVEDPLLHRQLPSGRYPYQTKGDTHRNVATVPNTAAEQQQKTIEHLRSHLRRQLISDGWIVTEMSKHGYLLPGSAR